MSAEVEKIFKPSIIFGELLRKAYGDSLLDKQSYSPFLLRALVIAVDPFGGRLENKDGVPDGPHIEHEVKDEDGRSLARYTVKTNVGPRNPMNSIKARLLKTDHDEFVDDDDLRVYWPMYQNTELPSPGELVYTVFEDQTMSHGLWLAKVTHNLADERVNHVFINSQLHGSPQSKGVLFGDAYRVGDDSVPNSRRLSNLFGDSNVDQ